MLTDQAELVLQAESLLDRVNDAVSWPHELDVIGGNAGAIPVLLSLSRESGLERCHDLAIALGEELCRTAVEQRSGWAWEPEAASGSGMGPVPQTGLSHGAGGMGLALFELYSATRRPDFLEIGRGAFAFEDALFDRVNGNWPDLRRNIERPNFARSWCHGAPGIALARFAPVCSMTSVGRNTTPALESRSPRRSAPSKKTSRPPGPTQPSATDWRGWEKSSGSRAKCSTIRPIAIARRTWVES